ncbi:MAG: ATP-grasp domain-containing protein [Gammaproteobacteria bacterium]|nr:ATP-grasp domain-containing protein [Gammaproteobacteria bacterium]
MFHKLLIANRGEIACRIIRTAKRLGVTTVAVYSEADRAAEHVSFADEAYSLGAPMPSESYLNIEKIIQIAKETQVEAIHPGYGFLSENPDFAEACEAEKIIFVGPPSAVIRKMGLKNEARREMQASKVPVVPGFMGSQSPSVLADMAFKIGFPIVIKPVAGGGGKGMQFVSEPGLFEDALRRAEREAQSAFGNADVLIEKYLPLVRHVEVQIFADQHGSVVHLFERDCSIQRRHQKIIEETPAPHLPDELKRRMWATAITSAKTIGYVGAGTVEFLVDVSIPNPTQFYFMEMNTRLQVEHVVTEMVTGLDLVEWQLLVAAGLPLPLSQDEITFFGHAIETRIYAEEEETFLPAAGKIHHIRWSEPSPNLRIETALKKDDEVSVYYDPLIAKLIAFGRDRSEALQHISKALIDTEVIGVAVNTGLLYQVVQHPEYQQGHFATNFIELQKKVLLFSHRDDIALQALVCGWIAGAWQKAMGWTVNHANTEQNIGLQILNKFYSIPVSFKRSEFLFRDEKSVQHTVAVEVRTPTDISIVLDGQGAFHGKILQLKGASILFWQARAYPFRAQDVNDFEVAEEVGMARELTAPMVGVVAAVFVKPNQLVKKGEKLIILEAMKMEHILVAPYEGSIKKVTVQVGELVPLHGLLIEFL